MNKLVLISKVEKYSIVVNDKYYMIDIIDYNDDEGDVFITNLSDGNQLHPLSNDYKLVMNKFDELSNELQDQGDIQE